MAKKSKTTDANPSEVEAKEITTESEEITKSPTDSWRGGADIDLDKKLESGNTLKDELSQHISALLDIEIANQKEFIEEKIPKWTKMYSGVRGEKSWPFDHCANTAGPEMRSNVDTIFVRVHDAIFNKNKVWIVRPKKSEYTDLARQIEDALDWFQRNRLKLKSKLISPMLQGLKIGTGIIKFVYEEVPKTVYRYATDKDKKKNEHLYSIKDSKTKLVKSKKFLYEGPNIYPVDRADFIISSDATTIEEALLVGFRKRFTEAELKIRVKQNLFDTDAVNKIISEDDPTEVQKTRADNQGKALKTIKKTEKKEIWELWTRYDVDEDGEEDDIVVWFHRETGQIVRSIYNPMFYGYRPLCDLVFYPLEFSFDGDGICAIMEKVQEEIDTMHNQRIDRIHQINCPVLFIRSGSGIEGLKKITPGMIYPVDEDPNQAIKEFRFSDVTPSSFNEEDRLVAKGDRSCGINPAVQGLSTAERPVAKETGIRVEETNKKFKFGTENFRDKLAEVGYKLLEMMAQYQPKFTYYQKEGGFNKAVTVDFPLESIRDAFEIELLASSELINQGERREASLTLYQLLKDYMTGIFGMAQVFTNPQAPSSIKKIILNTNDVSAKIINRIIQDFPDVMERDKLILDIRTAVGGDEEINKLIQNSPDLQPPPPPQQPQETPPGPGGPPPEMMGQQGPPPQMQGGPPPPMG